jgi:hypothetical protein
MRQCLVKQEVAEVITCYSSRAKRAATANTTQQSLARLVLVIHR